MAEPISLLEVLKDAPYEASIITTYNATLPFYEDFVLPKLISAKSRLNVVMMDSAQCARAWATPSQYPRLAGSAYTLVPMKAPGAFHPKVCILIGKTRCELLVGSHNLTLAGFGFNREISNWVRIIASKEKGAAPEASHALDDTWRLIRSWIAAQGERLPDAVLHVVDNLEKALQPFLRVPQLPSSLRVLGQSPGLRPLLDQLCDAIRRPPRRVAMTGAFFDQGQAFLQEVESRWPAAQIRVVIDRDTVVLGRPRSNARAAFVCGTKIWPDIASRYLHAKALVLDFGDAVALVSGSANPSKPAWLFSDRANIEAVMLRTDLAAADEVVVRELMSAFSAVPLTEEELNAVPVRLDSTDDDHSATNTLPVFIAAADEQGLVRIPCAVSSGATAACAVDHLLHEQTVALAWGTAGDAMIQLGESARSVRWLVLSTDDGPRIRVVVQHPPTSKSSDASIRRAEWIQAIVALSDSVTVDWGRFVELAESVLFDQDSSSDNRLPPATPGGRSASSMRPGGKAREEHRDDPLGEVLRALFANRRASPAPSDPSMQGQTSTRNASLRAQALEAEEANVAMEDEAFVHPLEQAASDSQIAAVRESVNRILLKVQRMLVDVPQGGHSSKSARQAVDRLVIALSLVRELSRSRLDPRWRRADGFVDVQRQRALLQASMSGVFRRSGGLAEALIDAEGRQPERLREGCALLLWLAWNLGLKVQRGITPTSTPLALRDAAWNNAMLYELLPRVVDSTTTLALLQESICTTRRPFEVEQSELWLREHSEVGEVFATLLEHEVRDTKSARVAELVKIPHERPSSFRVASFVNETMVSVIEFEGEDGCGGRSFSRHHDKPGVAPNSARSDEPELR